MTCQMGLCYIADVGTFRKYKREVTGSFESRVYIFIQNSLMKSQWPDVGEYVLNFVDYAISTM